MISFTSSSASNSNIIGRSINHQVTALTLDQSPANYLVRWHGVSFFYLYDGIIWEGVRLVGVVASSIAPSDSSTISTSSPWCRFGGGCFSCAVPSSLRPVSGQCSLYLVHKTLACLSTSNFNCFVLSTTVNLGGGAQVIDQ